MLTNYDSNWNIKDLTDREIYAAIRYLEVDGIDNGAEEDDEDGLKDNIKDNIFVNDDPIVGRTTVINDGDTVTILDNDVPLASFDDSDTIDIFDEDVPLTEMSILDNDVPLSMMPNTGLADPISFFTSGLLLSAILVSVIGVSIRKLRKSEEESER